MNTSANGRRSRKYKLNITIRLTPSHREPFTNTGDDRGCIRLHHCVVCLGPANTTFLFPCVTLEAEVPHRNPMSPPQLAADAPVADVFVPGLEGLGVTGGVEA